MKKLHMVLALMGMLTVSQMALAQDAGSPLVTPGENGGAMRGMGPHSNISPEEREARRAALQQKFKSMTPEEKRQFLTEMRAKMQKRYDAASPEQKVKIKERMDKLDARLKNPGMTNEPGQ